MSTKQVPDSVAIRSPPKAKRSKLLLSLEMESSVTVEQRFRPNDLELLQTGQYSDAQVTAEGRVWKVHKGIVCQRSVFMRDFLSDQSTEQTPKPKNLLPGTTKAQAELLLEFIYSGSIKDIDTRTLADCVELALIGHRFLVVGMLTYATEALRTKLKVYLQQTVTLPAGGETPRYGVAVDARVKEAAFQESFAQAVRTAYSGKDSHDVPHNTCQPILADFVWVARSLLLGTSFIEQLNVEYPRFGSHVLTTLNKGPQSPFVMSDGELTSTFCTKCAQEEVDGSGKAIEGGDTYV